MQESRLTPGILKCMLVVPFTMTGETPGLGVKLGTLLDMMTLRGPQVTEYLHSKQVWAGDLGIVSLQMPIEAI